MLCPDGLPHSGRVLSVKLGDRAVGVCGVLHGPDFQAFSVISDELREYPMGIARAGKKLVELIKSYNSRVIAVADSGIDRSGAFLRYLGFDYHGVSDGKELYIWQED